MVLLSKKNQIEKIIFVGATKAVDESQNPCPWNPTIFYSTAEIERYNIAMKKIATENDISYIDIFDLVNDSEMSDGLHPDSKGHQSIAEHVVASLRKILNR